MGPPENLTRHCEKKEACARKRPVRRPRARRCLLKGCERRFHPEHARQHYCSSECRGAAREWSEWKARRKYRATAAGKRKRNGQSQRYRKRVKERKPPEKEAVSETARVITKKFFRWLLRPAWLL
jgi:Bacteriophage Lambda NinG protein